MSFQVIGEAPKKKDREGTKYADFIRFVASIPVGESRRICASTEEASRYRVVARCLSADCPSSNYRKHRLEGKTVETRVTVGEEGAYVDLYVEDACQTEP